MLIYLKKLLKVSESMVEFLKSVVNDNVTNIKCIIYGILNNKVLNSKITKNDKKIFVYLSGFYQNLGDMAITYSQEQFLKKNFPEYKIIMVPSVDTYTTIRWAKSIVNNDDIITIVGGGSMDSNYASLENCRRFVIRCFKKNKIVLFPQTMHFNNDLYGRYRLKKTIKTYSKHNNLHIFAREYNSYENMKKMFKNAKIVEVIPDMVLYLDYKEAFKQNRKGLLCVFRNDIEKNCNFNTDAILKTLKEKFDFIEYTDTIDVKKEECEYKVYEKTILSFLNRIASKELVVTDRLHCMIFCAITETPCIAFDNSNKKISRVYKAWLSSLHYISVVSNYQEDTFKKLIDSIQNSNERHSNFEYLSKFDLIKSVLKD